MSHFPAELSALYRSQGYWGDVTIPALFRATATRVPDRLGLVDAPNRADFFEGAPLRLSYDDMLREVDRYAAILRAQGIGKGSLVATQLPNVCELVLLYLAVMQIGAVLSPISFAYRSSELRALSDMAAFDAYISVGRFRGKDYYGERIGALPDDVSLMGLGDHLPEGVHRIDTASAPEGMSSALAGISADDLAAVFWTSGTEGVPKAVPKTHNNMMASSYGAWRILGLADGSSVLAPFPFVNAAAIGGLMMCWMRTAGALFLHHPYDVDVFLDQLRSEDVTYTMVSPTVLIYLRDYADDPRVLPALQRLRALSTGSAPPDPETFAFFHERFDIPVLNFFGSNEGAQLGSSGERVPDPRQRARFFPRDGDENWPDGAGRFTANGGIFRLVEPESRAPVTAAGGVGEMHIRGPALMPGYYSRRGIDRASLDSDGFFATGDLFQISECGTLVRFHGRARELIVRGGLKISPAELDAIFSALPGVREVGAAPYADRRMGEKVCLFAALKAGAELTLDDVRAFADAAGLAKFKWPEKLVVCDALPRTPLAKLDRKALARQLAVESN